MKCTKCKRTATVAMIDKQFCKQCFCDLVERKVRKRLRGYGLRKGDKVKVEGEAARHFIENVVNLPLEIVEKRGKYEVEAWTTEDEGADFLGKVFTGKRLKKDKGKQIKLFYELSVSDVNSYFKFKGKKIRLKRDGDLFDMLDKLEKKYVGVKRALLKSSERVLDVMG